MIGSLNCGKILDYLNDCEVLKKDAFLWTWHYRFSSVAFDLAPFAPLFTEFTFPLYSGEGIFAQSLLTQALLSQTVVLLDLPPNETCSATTDTLVF